MVGHDIYFDIPENNRIGFAASDCNYTNRINGKHANLKDITNITTRWDNYVGKYSYVDRCKT